MTSAIAPGIDQLSLNITQEMHVRASLDALLGIAL